MVLVILSDKLLRKLFATMLYYNNNCTAKKDSTSAVFFASILKRDINHYKA